MDICSNILHRNVNDVDKLYNSKEQNRFHDWKEDGKDFKLKSNQQRSILMVKNNPNYNERKCKLLL